MNAKLMNAKLWLPFLVAFSSTGACADHATTASRYTLTFTAFDDRGEVLAGVQIRVGETAIGATDALGELEAEVNAMNGDRYALHAPCPADYEAGEVPKEVVFLNTRGLGGEKNAKMEVHITCSRRVLIAAVLIHAGGREGMPIFVDGVARGKTGPKGFAHIRLEGPAAKQFQLSLDTSSAPGLLPRNPRHAIQLGAADGIFVFDPAFSEAEPAPRPKRRRRRRRRERKAPEGPKRPVKID